MPKPYSCPTSPKQGTDVETKVDRSQAAKIWSCNHLTPITEAKMDNLLVPTKEEVIKRNSPGYEPELGLDWMDTAKPTRKDLNEIEAENQPLTVVSE